MGIFLDMSFAGYMLKSDSHQPLGQHLPLPSFSVLFFILEGFFHLIHESFFLTFFL